MMKVRLFAPMNSPALECIIGCGCGTGLVWDVERTKVEEKVADSHAYDGDWRCTSMRHTVVHAAGNEEQHHQQKEARGEEMSSVEAVDEHSAARTTSNGRNRNSEEVLLSLFQQCVVDCIAGLCIVGLPGRKHRFGPDRNGGVAAFEG